MFSAAAFAEPALFALTIPPAESTARAAGQRVGMAEVEVLTEQIAHLSKLSHQYGSGRVRGQVVQLLRREANQLLHASARPRPGQPRLPARMPEAGPRAAQQAGSARIPGIEVSAVRGRAEVSITFRDVNQPVPADQQDRLVRAVLDRLAA